MSAPIRDRRHVCADGSHKRPLSRDAAKRAAERLRAVEEIPMEFYKCAVCGRWHIGSRRG